MQKLSLQLVFIFSDIVRRCQIGGYLSKNLIFSVLIPMILIFDLSRKGFFIIVKESKYEGFTYVNQPSIEPRRQFLDLKSCQDEIANTKRCTILTTSKLPSVEC